jgi:hypothetical protein
VGASARLCVAQYVATIALIGGSVAAALAGRASPACALIIVAIVLLGNALWGDAMLCQREGTVLRGADPNAVRKALGDAGIATPQPTPRRPVEVAVPLVSDLPERDSCRFTRRSHDVWRFLSVGHGD